MANALTIEACGLLTIYDHCSSSAIRR